MYDSDFLALVKEMANDVAAASLSHQQRRRSVIGRKNKGPAVKKVLCTPYVTKWLVVFKYMLLHFTCLCSMLLKHHIHIVAFLVFQKLDHFIFSVFW